MGGPAGCLGFDFGESAPCNFGVWPTIPKAEPESLRERSGAAVAVAYRLRWRGGLTNGYPYAIAASHFIAFLICATLLRNSARCASQKSHPDEKQRCWAFPRGLPHLTLPGAKLRSCLFA